ncbi:MAG: hypothetical protein V7K53_20905 [Nostoc sp.]
MIEKYVFATIKTAIAHRAIILCCLASLMVKRCLSTNLEAFSSSEAAL